ncbi:MAG: hypothetical protein AB7T49_21395 [Oligoflexales bacterium]
MRRTINYLFTLTCMVALNSQAAFAGAYVAANYLSFGGEDAKAIYDAIAVEPIFDCLGSSEGGCSRTDYKVIEGHYTRPLNAKKTTFFCSQGLDDGAYGCALEGDFSKSSVQRSNDFFKIDLGSFLKKNSVRILIDALSNFDDATHVSADGAIVVHCASRSDCYLHVNL